MVAAVEISRREGIPDDGLARKRYLATIKTMLCESKDLE